MFGLGLLQDQVSQIHNRAQSSWNYTEELLSALFPANVLLPSSPDYSTSIAQYLYVSSICSESIYVCVAVPLTLRIVVLARVSMPPLFLSRTVLSKCLLVSISWKPLVGNSLSVVTDTHHIQEWQALKMTCSSPWIEDVNVRLLGEHSGLGIVECFADRRSLARVVRECSRPDSIGKRESVHVESCNDAKVVRAAFESPPKISILFGIGIDNLATSKNNLKIGYIRTREPATAEEVRKTICRGPN